MTSRARGHQAPSPLLADFHRLTQETRRCGWTPDESSVLKGELFFQTFQGGQVAPCQGYVNPAGQRLIVIALPDLLLPDHDSLFPRFVNLPLETRMVLAMVKLVGGYEWLLLTTRGRGELIRVAEETTECRAEREDAIQADLLPALAALARDRAAVMPGGASHLSGAVSLRDWIRHWALHLAPAIEQTPDETERIIWKWILMLQTIRRIEGSEAAGDWGLRCKLVDGRWSISYDALSATDDLCHALERFDQSFSTWLFDADVAGQIRRLRRLEETSLLDRLRAELLMHSQDRFEPETVAWMFTDLEREQEGWRREVAGVEPARKRIQHDGWTIFQPLTVDVAHYGLTAALGDADRLAHYLNDQHHFFSQRRKIEDEGPLTIQPDLFCPNPRGIGPGGLLDDGANYLFGEALRLRGVEPGRRFGVGVTFLLKGLALIQHMDWPFLGIDTLDRLFVD
jgi:hypothetical protein